MIIKLKTAITRASLILYQSFTNLLANGLQAEQKAILIIITTQGFTEEEEEKNERKLCTFPY